MASEPHDSVELPTAAALAERLAPGLAQVRAQIAAAAARSGRPTDAVRLVVVTKSAPPAIFPALAELGVRDVGENRVQGAEDRLAGHEERFRWHFIGHLQSNKVRRAMALFDVFHGVDSIPLLERLDRVAGEVGRTPELLLQVNVSGEDSKSGLEPAEVAAALEVAAGLHRARVTGLMTMAPVVDDPEQARPVFAALARLRDHHRRDHPGLTELSMGMTDDFVVAVEEGATLVRIGRRLVAPAT